MRSDGHICISLDLIWICLDINTLENNITMEKSKMFRYRLVTSFREKKKQLRKGTKKKLTGDEKESSV